MRLDKIDLNLFVIFDAVYRERNVTKVAQRLNITQPAVSNSLARLRQTFNDVLFIRTPQGMSPTPVADNLIGDVRRALALLEKSVGQVAHFEPLKSQKTFRLAMNDLTQLLLLPGLQRTVATEAPNIAINSYYIDRSSAVEELKSSTLDLLIDVPQLNAKELGQSPLAELPYVVAMRKGHPLATATLTLEDYLKSEHIHVSSRRKGRGQADVALHEQGLRRNIAMRVQHYAVAAAVVANSDLLWSVPEVMATGAALQTVPLPFEITPLSLNLYWAKSATDDPANIWMRELLQRDSSLLK